MISEDALVEESLTSKLLHWLVASLLMIHVESGSNSMHGHRTSLPSLLSKIQCPAEANPSWRWSFYKPWKNLSSEPTDLQKMDELHACQTLVVILSNILGKKSSNSRVLSCQDFEICSVFEWERSIIEAENSQNTQPKVSSRLKSKGFI
ncbi:hypothetical protein Q3G72_013962 [Acer saccharum]|nr:hypothetical protein Q3G72_013962 [Acer saccharum]